MDILIYLALFVVAIFVFRWIGAWMLRIDELISTQKRTNQILESITRQLDDITFNQKHSE